VPLGDIYDWEAPIVIVGAGRSGTTLLASVLGEHPRHLLDRRDVVSPSSTVGDVLPDPNTFAIIAWEGQPVAQARVARPVVVLVLAGDSQSRPVKNPGPLRHSKKSGMEAIRSTTSWKTYTDALPNPQYVQCVRNPFAFAKSSFANNQKQPSEADLIYLLRNGSQSWSERASYGQPDAILNCA
jgi:hypothetical protein